MKVHELIERLEEYDGDLPVKLMTQRHYPLEYEIDGVVSREQVHQYTTEGVEPDAELDERDTDLGKPENNCVWLNEGHQIGYGARIVWEAADVVED